MGMLREWIYRLWGTLRGLRADSDLEQELRLHIELAAEDAQRRDQTPQDAARGVDARRRRLASDERAP